MKTIYIIKEAHYSFADEDFNTVVSALNEGMSEDDISTVTRHDDGTVTGELSANFAVLRSQTSAAVEALQNLADEFLPAGDVPVGSRD